MEWRKVMDSNRIESNQIKEVGDKGRSYGSWKVWRMSSEGEMVRFIV